MILGQLRIGARATTYAALMQTAGGDVERPPEEVEEEQAVVEMDEQRFEDIYTPEVYYDLPRALPMQYYAIA